MFFTDRIIVKALNSWILEKSNYMVPSIFIYETFEIRGCYNSVALVKTT